MACSASQRARMTVVEALSMMGYAGGRGSGGNRHSQIMDSSVSVLRLVDLS